MGADTWRAAVLRLTTRSILSHPFHCVYKVITELSEKFAIVLITEHMHESLLLMKKM
jgi:hypothetical protein